MSDVDDSLPYVEIQGKRLGKVSVYLRAELLREDVKSRRQAVLDDLSAAGITGRDAFDLLSERVGRVSEDDWTRYINTPLGKAEILERCAEAQNPGKGAEVLQSLILNPDAELNVVADLCCLPRPNQQRADAGYDDPNARAAGMTSPSAKSDTPTEIAA